MMEDMKMKTPQEKINRRIAKMDEWVKKNRLKKSHPTTRISIDLVLERGIHCQNKDELATALFDLSLLDYEIVGLYRIGHPTDISIYIALKKKDTTTKSIDADFVEKVLSWCD
jgi:hypothetical protein